MGRTGVELIRGWGRPPSPRSCEFSDALWGMVLFATGTSCLPIDIGDSDLIITELPVDRPERGLTFLNGCTLLPARVQDEGAVCSTRGLDVFRFPENLGGVE